MEYFVDQASIISCFEYAIIKFDFFINRGRAHISLMLQGINYDKSILGTENKIRNVKDCYYHRTERLNIWSVREFHHPQKITSRSIMLNTWSSL